MLLVSEVFSKFRRPYNAHDFHKRFFKFHMQIFYFHWQYLPLCPTFTVSGLVSCVQQVLELVACVSLPSNVYLTGLKMKLMNLDSG